MKNTPSNKNQGLTKSINMDIWVTGTLKQLFMRASIGIYKRKVI